MPTTLDEAKKIIKICIEERVPRSSMANLFRRLKEEVGDKSDNTSVRDTMTMLYEGAKLVILQEQLKAARAQYNHSWWQRLYNWWSQ